MRHPVRFRVIVPVLTAIVLVHGLSAPATAQISPEALLGGVLAPDTNLSEYKDVADAIVLFRRGNASGSLALLAKARNEHPELAPSEVMFAHLCFAFDSIDEGRAVLESSVVNQPEDPEAYIMIADLAMRQGRMAESEAMFRKGLDLTDIYDANEVRKRSMRINAHAGIARVFESRRQWDQAEGHLRDWIDLDRKKECGMETTRRSVL